MRILLAFVLIPTLLRGQAPEHVSVRAVFVVPRGQRAPSTAQQGALLHHLQVARDRYTVMLGGQDSFALEPYVAIVPLAITLDSLRRLPEVGAPAVVAALLEAWGVNRVTCPWVMVAVIMNPDDDFPPGGGRPLNGGLNTGGGIVVLSSFALDRIPNVQSTIQHELGHAFGLPHVDVYGGDMQRDSSIMGYNPAHHTNGFLPSATPGILVSRDVESLSRNRRVFPNLRSGDATFTPVMLGPMDIPGQPRYGKP